VKDVCVWYNYDIIISTAMVSTVAVDGVPKSDLPPRRMLWDILKPQAAQVSIAYTLHVSYL